MIKFSANDLPGSSRAVFFALGNGEVQKYYMMSGYSLPMLKKNINTQLKIGALLNDYIFQPTAHYYVGPTRKITLECVDFFKGGVAVYALGEDVTSFRDDAFCKTSEYPAKSSIFYNNALIRQSVRELNSFGHVFSRMGSIGELTGQLWQNELQENIDNCGIIAKFIHSNKELSKKTQENLLTLLRELPHLRNREAFTWDYIKSNFSKYGFELPKRVLDYLEIGLLRCYLLACSACYHANILGLDAFCHDNDVPGASFDAFLFWADIFRLKEMILSLNPKEIMEIKTSFDSFSPFLTSYYDLIDGANHIYESEKKLIMSEAVTQKKAEVQEIKNMLINQKFAFLQTLREYKQVLNLSLLYNPKHSNFYHLKKTLVNYEKMSFIHFKDELLYNFSKNVHSQVEQIGNIALSDVVGNNFFNKCNFLLAGKFQTDSQGEVMPSIKFNGGTFFHCQIGDSNTMNIITKNLSNTYGISESDSAEACKYLISMLELIDKEDDISDRRKKIYCELIESIYKELQQPDTVDKSTIQRYWNKIKEGISTSSQLTSIAVGFAKLLGIA